MQSGSIFVHNPYSFPASPSALDQETAQSDNPNAAAVAATTIATTQQQEMQQQLAHRFWQKRGSLRHSSASVSLFPQQQPSAFPGPRPTRSPQQRAASLQGSDLSSEDGQDYREEDGVSIVPSASSSLQSTPVTKPATLISAPPVPSPDPECLPQTPDRIQNDIELLLADDEKEVSEIGEDVHSNEEYYHDAANYPNFPPPTYAPALQPCGMTCPCHYNSHPHPYPTTYPHPFTPSGHFFAHPSALPYGAPFPLFPNGQVALAPPVASPCLLPIRVVAPPPPPPTFPPHHHPASFVAPTPTPVAPATEVKPIDPAKVLLPFPPPKGLRKAQIEDWRRRVYAEAPCTHSSMWRRLRTRKCVDQLFCSFCGNKWRIGRRGELVSVDGTISLNDGVSTEESDSE